MQTFKTLYRILLLAPILLISLEAQAQYSPRNFAPGHEVHLSIGAFDWVFLNNVQIGTSMPPPDNISYYFNTSNLGFPTLDIGAHLAADNYIQGSAYVTGIISAGYTYRFVRWFELSGAFSYSGSVQTFYPSDPKLSAERYSMNYISLLPMAKFIWFRTKYVNMYSSIGLGIALVVESFGTEHATKAACSFHFNPVGIAVGRRVYGFAELGCGTMGAVRAGIGVKIGKY